MTFPRYLTDRFGTCLAEPPVKILVGEDRKVYHVHPSIFSSSKLSSADARMSGAWKTTGDDAVNWTDYDRQTIECVLHYLYTGDYYICQPVDQAPISERDNAEISLEPPEGESLPADNISPEYQTQPSDGSTLMRPLTPISRCLEIGLPEERLKTAAGAVAETECGDHSLAPGMSILVHAKVYSFAHCNFFSDLARFALQRLTQILVLVPCERNSLFPYLADAIRYVYNTTPQREIEDPARTLLSQYIALNYADLTGEDLDALFDEGGEFVVDVMNKVARRLTTSGHCVQSMEKQMDDLAIQIRVLEAEGKDKDMEIEKANREIQGWENWNRGSSKKMRRNIAPVFETGTGEFS